MGGHYHLAAKVGTHPLPQGNTDLQITACMPLCETGSMGSLGSLPWGETPHLCRTWADAVPSLCEMGGETPTCILVVGSNKPNLALAIPKGEEGKREKRKREMTASLFPSSPFSLFRRLCFALTCPTWPTIAIECSRPSEVIQFGQLFCATSASHSSIRNVENGHRSTRLK